MEQGYLIDTNVIIDNFGNKLPEETNLRSEKYRANIVRQGEHLFGSIILAKEAGAKIHYQG